MSRTIILSAIAAFTILAVWTIATTKRTPAATPAAAGLATKEQSGGNVTVIVTPEGLLATGKPAIFQIVFDTHSVDLDFDVAAAAELRDEKGNAYGPAVWSGDPPGGHHRKGILSFITPLEQSTTLSLIFKDIAGIKERAFVWKL